MCKNLYFKIIREEPTLSSFHYLGLFHKAIMQSGTALTSWSLTYDPIDWAFEAGRKLGYHGEDPKELVKHMKAVPANDIVKAMTQILGDILTV